MTHLWQSEQTSDSCSLEPERLTARESAQRILDHAASAVDARDRFVVVAAGGRTPRPVYQELELLGGQQGVDWDRWTVLLSDERCLPPGHDGRNDRMLADTLRSLAVAGRIWPIPVEETPAVAASLYTTTIQQVGPIDLAVLGLGADGHTAGLFPGSMGRPLSSGTARSREQHCIVARGIPGPATVRISLSAPVLSRAAQAWFLVNEGDRGKDWAVGQLILGGAIRANEIRANSRKLIALRVPEGEKFAQ